MYISYDCCDNTLTITGGCADDELQNDMASMLRQYVDLCNDLTGDVNPMDIALVLQSLVDCARLNGHRLVLDTETHVSDCKTYVMGGTILPALPTTSPYVCDTCMVTSLNDCCHM